MKKNELPVICDGNLRLRPITFDDTDLIVKWRNNERVRSNFIYRGEFTADIHKNWMETKVKSGVVIQYIIEDKGRPVGSVYYRDINYSYNSAEFGIFIGEESATGNGVGVRSLKMFLEFGFGYLNLHRVSVRVLSDNTISYKMCSRAGFVKEGIFRDMVMIDGVYRDVVFMAIIAD